MRGVKGERDVKGVRVAGSSDRGGRTWGTHAATQRSGRGYSCMRARVRARGCLQVRRVTVSVTKVES